MQQWPGEHYFTCRMWAWQRLVSGPGHLPGAEAESDPAAPAVLQLSAAPGLSRPDLWGGG